MFFEDLFGEDILFNDMEFMIPVLASIEEEEIEFENMTDEEMERYHEHLGQL